VTDVLARLRGECLARAAFIVNEEGNILSAETDAGTSLATLGHAAVECLDGAEGLARQINTPEFGVVLHDVTGEDVFVSPLAEGCTLGVLFDQGRTSLGNVRLRVKALRDELVREASGL
jgi:predicted regulator of Ras-like GTPase activity (Roadblock/LC7/MglB family)